MPDRGSESESESPAIPSPTPKGHRPLSNRDWWPNQLDLSILHRALEPCPTRWSEGFDYKDEFEDTRRRSTQAGHLRGDDRVAGVVAG